MPRRPTYIFDYGGNITPPNIVKVEPTFQRVISSSIATPMPDPADPEVWFIAGQSNAANVCIMSENLKTHYSGVYQYYNGQCYKNISPMLGAVGDGYNPFEQVAQDYVHRTGKPVVAAFFSIPGQPIVNFAPGGIYHATMLADLINLHTHFGYVTRFMWQQGEADSFLGTTYNTYLSTFNSMASAISPYVNAINIARSTICTTNVYDSPTGQALDTLRLTHPGPDTDTVTTDVIYRSDHCHFSNQGVLDMASLWQDYLP